MPTLTALGPFINLAISVLNLVGTEEAMKYISQLNQAKLDLDAEIAKGVDSDDAKVESLYAQIETLGETVQAQFALYQAKGQAAPSVPVTPPAPAAS